MEQSVKIASKWWGITPYKTSFTTTILRLLKAHLSTLLCYTHPFFPFPIDWLDRLTEGVNV